MPVRLSAAEARRLTDRIGLKRPPRARRSRRARIDVRYAFYERDLAGPVLEAIPADMLVARFRVPGTPVPKARPRFDPRSGRVYTPDTTAAWEAKIRTYYAIAGRAAPVPAGEGVGARLRFRTSSEVADDDNLAKAVLDALNGAAYADDRQIMQHYAEVERGVPASDEGVEIVVYRLAWLAVPSTAL